MSFAYMISFSCPQRIHLFFRIVVAATLSHCRCFYFIYFKRFYLKNMIVSVSHNIRNTKCVATVFFVFFFAVNQQLTLFSSIKIPKKKSQITVFTLQNRESVCPHVWRTVLWYTRLYALLYLQFLHFHIHSFRRHFISQYFFFFFLFLSRSCANLMDFLLSNLFLSFSSLSPNTKSK